MLLNTSRCLAEHLEEHGYFYNLPDDGVEMQNYLKDVLKINSKKSRTAIKAQIIFTDLRTGKAVSLKPSAFREKIKTNYFLTDFLKIEPENLGLTKRDVLESSYHSLKVKLTQ